MCEELHCMWKRMQEKSGSTRSSQCQSSHHCELRKESRGEVLLLRFFFFIAATDILLLSGRTNISFIFNTYPLIFSKLVKGH